MLRHARGLANECALVLIWELYKNLSQLGSVKLVAWRCDCNARERPGAEMLQIEKRVPLNGAFSGR